MVYKKSTVVIISSIVLLTIATAIVSYFLFSQPAFVFNFFKKDAVKTIDSKVSTQKQISGRLYFSLIPDNASMPLGIYSYDTFTKKLSRILVDPSSTSPDYNISLSPSFSDDETVMVFSRKKKSETSFQIYTASPDGSGIKQITNSSEIYKREPIISPSKRLIAYIVERMDTKEGEVAELPESWGVFLTDFSGNTKQVTNGVNPLFSPDETKLLVLKNDGLHIFDIKERLNPKEIGLVVKTTGGRASQTMKLSLSRDRNMLAWSSPGKKNVVISRINSWETFSITPVKVLQVKAYWSVFSPDGKSLGLQEIRVSEKTGNEYVVISVYDIATSVAKDIIKLNKYTNEFLWFGGWIKQ
jgi:hypothetical protein